MNRKIFLIFISLFLVPFVHAQNFSNIRVFPTSPTFYHPATEYDFSIEIQEPSLSTVILSLNGTNYSSYTGEITNNSNRFKIVFIGLSPGYYNYYWYLNSTSGTSNITSTQSYFISQGQTLNPLLFSLSPTQALPTDTILFSVQAFLSGQAPYQQNNFTNTTLFIYNFTGGIQNLVFNTSNFTYTNDGKWNFIYNATNRGTGAYLASVLFTTNETSPQTFEKIASFSVNPQSTDMGGILTGGALFLPNDTLIVDAIFTNTQGSNIAGAQCNLTLLDQNKSIVLSRANMPENTFTDISHYTYINTNFINTTNTTTTGNYYGHIQCTSGTLTRVSSLSFAILDLPNRIKNVLNISNNTLVTNQIIAINTSLVALINKDFSFDQEQIFLITDSLNQINSLATQVAQGTLSPEQAQEQLQKIKQNLLDHLQQQKTQTIEPKSKPASFFNQNFHLSLNGKILIFGLLFGIVLFLIFLCFKSEEF